jgi:hypothetical protein
VPPSLPADGSLVPKSPAAEGEPGRTRRDPLQHRFAERASASEQLQALQVVLIPTRLQFDHRPQRLGRKRLPGAVEGYRHAAAIRMQEMLM